MRCPACSSENLDKYISCESCGVPRIASAFRPASKRAGSGNDDNFASTMLKADGKLLPVMPPGEVLADRFELRSELGRGGSGLVYRAFDRVLGVEVAVKVLLPGFTRDATAIERLKREIIAARRVSHRNVIRINEFVLSDKESFVAMEYLTGGNLTKLLDEGPVPIGRGVHIAMGLCDGLAAAHAVGVIHRDVKPDNLLFDGAGVPKLMDFGHARLSETSGLTVGFSGTPFYMSPEQGEGREITTKTDVYSAGVLLFQLFTGTLPFEAESLVRIAVLHAKQSPPNPRSRRPDLPPMLEALILHTLAKDPAQRPTAAEVVVSLHSIAALLGDSTSLPLVLPKPLPPLLRRADPETAATDPAGPAVADVRPAPVPAPTRSRRTAVIALLLFAIPAAIALPFITGLVGKSPDATATPTVTAIAEIIELPASVAPVPSVTETLVVVTVTATPVQTQVAVAPSPTSTVRTIVTPIPGVATPPPVATGLLTVKSIPSVEVWVDGKRMWDRTPVRQQPLPVGKHVLLFKNSALRYEAPQSITIVAGTETKVNVNTESGAIRVD